MRISGIDEYLGGADNVKAFSMIQGEQRTFTGTIKDSDGTAIDIQDYTITARVEFYTAEATVTSRNATITDLTLLSAPAAKDLTVTKDSDSSTGNFTVLFPEDLYDVNIAADLTESVPLAITYIKYDDGTNARVSRVITVIRRGNTEA